MLVKSATKRPDGLNSPYPLTGRRVKAGVQGKEFFKTFAGKLYINFFCFFYAGKNYLIEFCCVFTRTSCLCLTLSSSNLNFNSDSSRFRNESKGNFQPQEYLLFE